MRWLLAGGVGGAAAGAVAHEFLRDYSYDRLENFVGLHISSAERTERADRVRERSDHAIVTPVF